MANCVLDSISMDSPPAAGNIVTLRWPPQRAMRPRRRSGLCALTSSSHFPPLVFQKRLSSRSLFLQTSGNDSSAQSSQRTALTPGAYVYCFPPHVRGENARREFSFISCNARRCVTPGTRWKDCLLGPERRGTHHGRHRMSDDAVPRGEDMSDGRRPLDLMC